MTSPSTNPVVKVLLSQIALIMDALNSCKRGTTETVLSPGGEDTFVVVSTTLGSHPMRSIAIVWMVRAIDV